MDGRGVGSGSGSASGSNTGTCPFLLRQSVKRSFSAMAESRRRRSSSPDSLFVSQDHHYNNEQPAHRHTPLALPSSSNARRSRYVGDGLDYRRPANTSAGGMGGSSNVIDLTSEDDNTRSTRIAPQASSSSVATPEPGPSRAQQRLPHFQSRNIIDVESDIEHEGEEREETRGGHRGGTSGHPNRRNGLQFTAPHYPLRDIDIMPATSSNSTAAAPSRRLPRPWEVAESQRSITPHPTNSTAHNRHTIDLTADDDDDVVFTEIRPRVIPQLNTVRPETTAGAGTRGVMDAAFGRATAAVGIAAGGVLGRMFAGFGGAGGAHVHPAMAHARQQLPGGALDVDFNYMTVAFQVGVEPPRAQTPAYEPPPKAEAGFTRSPGEDEEVVCPNCGDELCMGENEIKQQVWVIKGCGHAYCGGCAQHRASTKRQTKGGKGKGKAKVEDPISGAPPMKGCQVIGCGQKTGVTQMLRVYVDG